MRFLSAFGSGLAVCAGMVLCAPIPVRHPAISARNVFILKDQAGKVIATGDHVESVQEKHVESHLLFHFRDGSTDDESAVFTQNKVFRLLLDHHVQKGPSFPTPLDLKIDIANNEVAWKESKRGREHSRIAQMKLPDDLANGLIALMALNFSDEHEMRTSFLVLADGLRIVQLVLRPYAGESSGPRQFRMHVEIGGVGGFLASVMRKQPPDFRLWVTPGATPVFLKMEGPLYPGGPTWTMERSAPTP